MDFPDARGRRRLAQAVKRRRAELDLRQEDVSSQGGPSKATMFQIESAADKASYSDVTIGRLERALGWAAGSVVAIRDGGEPEQVKPSEAASRRDATGDASSDSPPALTMITAAGLVVRIQPAPGARLEDVIAKQNEIAEIVARKLAELDQAEQ